MLGIKITLLTICSFVDAYCSHFLFVVRGKNSYIKLTGNRTGIKSRTSLNFGQIGTFPSELGAFECLKLSHRLIIRKWCVQSSTFIFHWIFVKLAGNQERHNISDEFEFQQDQISHFGVTCS